MSEPYLVVGLGNPGPQYVNNRHNIGFAVVDLLAGQSGSRFKSHRSGTLVSDTRIAEQHILLAKPLSFMNLSGGPVIALMKFFKIPIDKLVVIHDELDIPFATIRLKKGGGDNGHNGLRSITAALGTPDYYRVRVGIGRPPGRQNPADFVLSNFPAVQRDDVEVLIERSAEAVEMLITDGLATAQNTFHSFNIK